MDFISWLDPEWAPWILPVIIFFARILDVSVGTLRIVFLTRGMKQIVPILAFFEVLVWVVIVSQVVRNINSWVNVIAYAGGYSTGNYLGMYLEDKLAIGTLIVRIITRRDATELIEHLKRNFYGVTNVPAYGNEGRVNLIFTVIKRSDLQFVLDSVQKYNPRAFYSVEDVRAVSDAIFPPAHGKFLYWNSFMPVKKRK